MFDFKYYYHMKKKKKKDCSIYSPYSQFKSEGFTFKEK